MFGSAKGQERLVLLAAVAVSGIILGGCVAKDFAPTSPYAGAQEVVGVPLPDYRMGTKFIYSNGTWEKVVKVGQGQVEWVNQRGNTSVTKVDFTYRSLQWRNKKFHGHRKFAPVKYWLSSPPATLWPLVPGNLASYDEIGVWTGEDGIEHSYGAFWHCEVKKAEKVQVSAGEFDTWKLNCSRYSNSRKYPGALSWEDKSWNYAPLINHWVVEEQDYHSYRSSRRRELVAILPDLSLLLPDQEARGAVKKQFQNTLEYKKSGESDLWQSVDGKTSVVIKVQKSFRHSDGNLCRQYEQKTTVDTRTDTWFGVACKTKDGSWRVPRR